MNYFRNDDISNELKKKKFFLEDDDDLEIENEDNNIIINENDDDTIPYINKNESKIIINEKESKNITLEDEFKKNKIVPKIIINENLEKKTNKIKESEKDSINSDENVSENIKRIESNINLDNIGVCYDCGHDHCHFKDAFNFDKFKDKIFCIHIHDNYGKIDDHLIPGDGTVNYDYVLDGLKRANFHDYFTMELCYRNDYLNENIVDFYKKGYERGLELKNKYEDSLK